MTPTPDRQQPDRLKQYDELFSTGLKTAAGALALVSGKDKVKAVMTAFSNGTPPLKSILAVILFALTLLLGVAWYVSGKHELQLLARYYGQHAPQRRFMSLPLIMFVATIIVVLSYYSDNILIYSSLYAIYLLFAVSAGWLSMQHVLKAIQNGKHDRAIPEQYQTEVFTYYVLRPGPVLGYLCSAITFGAVACAILGRYAPDRYASGSPELLAYGLMIVAILIGEAVVWTWRARLYRRTLDL